MLASLQHRNYRIFFFGQIISLTGTWMQMVAEAWLIYEITRSPATQFTLNPPLVEWCFGNEPMALVDP